MKTNNWNYCQGLESGLQWLNCPTESSWVLGSQQATGSYHIKFNHLHVLLPFYFSHYTEICFLNMHIGNIITWREKLNISQTGIQLGSTVHQAGDSTSWIWVDARPLFTLLTNKLSSLSYTHSPDCQCVCPEQIFILITNMKTSENQVMVCYQAMVCY